MDTYDVIKRDHRDQLGEGPLWSSRLDAVFWVDIIEHRLHRLSVASAKVDCWSLPDPIG